MTRAERRIAEGKRNEPRAFTNKKGIQLIVTGIGQHGFVKHHRVLQYIDGKVILHNVERPNRLSKGEKKQSRKANR